MAEGMMRYDLANLEEDYERRGAQHDSEGNGPDPAEPGRDSRHRRGGGADEPGGELDPPEAPLSPREHAGAVRLRPGRDARRLGLRGVAAPGEAQGVRPGGPAPRRPDHLLPADRAPVQHQAAGELLQAVSGLNEEPSRPFLLAEGGPLPRTAAALLSGRRRFGAARLAPAGDEVDDEPRAGVDGAGGVPLVDALEVEAGERHGGGRGEAGQAG